MLLPWATVEDAPFFVPQDDSAPAILFADDGAEQAYVDALEHPEVMARCGRRKVIRARARHCCTAPSSVVGERASNCMFLKHRSICFLNTIKNNNSR